MDDYEDIISLALRHVPNEYIDDARQAGYIGLLNGLKHADNTHNMRGYLFRCASNEILRELASLQRPFALNKDTYCNLLKYKKFKRYGKAHMLSFNTIKIEELEQIMSSEKKGLLHE